MKQRRWDRFHYCKHCKLKTASSDVSVQDLLKQSQDSHSVLQTVAQTQTTLAKKVGANPKRAAFSWLFRCILSILQCAQGLLGTATVSLNRSTLATSSRKSDWWRWSLASSARWMHSVLPSQRVKQQPPRRSSRLHVLTWPLSRARAMPCWMRLRSRRHSRSSA